MLRITARAGSLSKGIVATTAPPGPGVGVRNDPLISRKSVWVSARVGVGVGVARMPIAEATRRMPNSAFPIASSTPVARPMEPSTTQRRGKDYSDISCLAPQSIDAEPDPIDRRALNLRSPGPLRLRRTYRHDPPGRP